MKILLLSSGSDGNCVYLEEEGGGILIDAGISRKRIISGLGEFSINNRQIQAVFITHEHADHVKGLNILCKYENYPVYATEGTIQRATFYNPCADFRTIFCQTQINGFNITAVPLPHDANEPVGYVIEGSSSRLFIATDLGYVTDKALQEISRANAVIFESNHDLEMLNNGRYPEHLKSRIRSKWGHLSNSQCSAALNQAKWKGLELVILAHLSKENNYPHLALTEAQKALDKSIVLIAASRQAPTGPFEI